jgi:hypothetical protein
MKEVEVQHWVKRQNRILTGDKNDFLVGHVWYFELLHQHQFGIKIASMLHP